MAYFHSVTQITGFCVNARCINVWPAQTIAGQFSARAVTRVLSRAFIADDHTENLGETIIEGEGLHGELILAIVMLLAILCGPKACLEIYLLSAISLK